MLSGWKHSVLKTLLTLTWAYFALLFGWGVLQHSLGDGFWWLFLLNVFAVYLFFPSPIILICGIYYRRKAVWIPALSACIWGLYLFGHLYLPQWTSPPKGRALTVMTFNVLGYNHQVEPIVQALRESDADVIALYELNPQLATALRVSLAEEYPYQHLDPRDGVKGSGLISRYPVIPTGEQLPGVWMGEPQILELNFSGIPVTIVLAHPFASNMTTPSRMEEIIHARETQARAIRDFAQSHSGPLIVPMDLNATPLNTAYKILTSELTDSWQTAGWGLGHTFPGAASPGSSRPHIGRMAVPMWLVRIDYVFHSHHFVASEARFGPWDGNSDHRPLLARLILKVKPEQIKQEATEKFPSATPAERER